MCHSLTPSLFLAPGPPPHTHTETLKGYSGSFMTLHCAYWPIGMNKWAWSGQKKMCTSRALTPGNPPIARVTSTP